ncbi:hypothetical protein SAMN04488121_101196 [Chitinophaga filiformis]|uniref:Uncharacterized protein n=1 Tax=Chitinophaga filiformis TaxID=104663 RepID=A0A1G7GWV9_CHIFI|nr:hypothetical protein SAMN04488121_101196 [Chitinophaga filiformis]
MGHIWFEDGLSMNYYKEQNRIRPFLQAVQMAGYSYILTHYLVGDLPAVVSNAHTPSNASSERRLTASGRLFASIQTG